jgi:hypothetical protein
MQFTQKDLSFAKNTIAFIAKAKIELVGTEIMAASDMLRWLYILTQTIEKELQEAAKPLSPSDVDMSSPVSEPKLAKTPKLPKKPKE